MLLLTEIVGQATDNTIDERLHKLSHDDAIEYLVLDRADLSRHRFRVSTDKGTDCAVALPRSQRLSNGTVLLLEAARAVVVRMKEEAWISLQPKDLNAALKLGYLAGNMHWRVRVEGETFRIAVEGEEDAYLSRLARLLDKDEVRQIHDD